MFNGATVDLILDAKYLWYVPFLFFVTPFTNKNRQPLAISLTTTVSFLFNVKSVWL